MHLGTKSRGELSGNIMINCLVSLMSVTIVLSVIVCMMSVRMVNEAAIMVENAMSAASLAGLSIDLDEFQKTYLTGNAQVVVMDEQESYEIFKQILYQNLEETEQFIRNISVKNYIVYNYIQAGNRIDIFYFENNCLKKIQSKRVGQVFAPNGINVNKTSVFADVSFDINVFGNLFFKCHRQLLSSAEKK